MFGYIFRYTKDSFKSNLHQLSATYEYSTRTFFPKQLIPNLLSRCQPSQTITTAVQTSAVMTVMKIEYEQEYHAKGKT